MKLPCIRSHPEGTLISLHVLPRSSCNRIIGLHGDSLKLKLTSPPIEGAANRCCCEYLAKLFGLAKTEVELLSGERARQKRVLLHGLNLQQAQEIVRSQIEGS